MKRFIICLSILSVIIFSGIFILNRLAVYSNEMTKQINIAEKLIENKKADDAVNQIDNIKQLWDRYYSRLSFILQYEKTSNIYSSVDSLESLLKYSDEDFLNECERLKVSIRLLYEDQRPTLNNLI